MEQTAGWIIVACWTCFLLYWLVSSLRGKKILERQSLPSQLAHRIPIGLGWWLACVVVGLGFWIKLSQEERLLLRHFPEAYPRYQREVSALVPGLL